MTVYARNRLMSNTWHAIHRLQRLLVTAIASSEEIIRATNTGTVTEVF